MTPRIGAERARAAERERCVKLAMTEACSMRAEAVKLYDKDRRWTGHACSKMFYAAMILEMFAEDLKNPPKRLRSPRRKQR